MRRHIDHVRKRHTTSQPDTSATGLLADDVDVDVDTPPPAEMGDAGNGLPAPAEAGEPTRSSTSTSHSTYKPATRSSTLYSCEASSRLSGQNHKLVGTGTCNPRREECNNVL